MTLPAELADRLRAAELDPQAVERLVDAALDEDLADGVDVTTVATVPAGQRGRVEVVARAAGVVAGLLVVEVTMLAAAGRTGSAPPTIERPAADGERVEPGQVLLAATGTTHALLLAERTALNMLCHLSGVATLTRRWVDAVAGTGAAVRDTRKTLPLLRALEKHAVRCGGGRNHRRSLSDAALVKDNHVAAAGGVVPAFTRVRDHFPDLPVEVEVDDVAGAVAAVDAGADLVLLDNFTVADLRAAVAAVGGRARLEASGGLSLDRAREVAATGVDFLAVGALTHSAPSLDIGVDLREVEG